MYKKRQYTPVISFALVIACCFMLVLAACGTAASPEETPVEETASSVPTDFPPSADVPASDGPTHEPVPVLSDYFPYISDCTGVYVMSSTYEYPNGYVYVPANDEQSANITELISSMEITHIAEENYRGSEYSFIIENPEGSDTLSIATPIDLTQQDSVPSETYIILSSGLTLVAERDSELMSAISDAVTAVRTLTGDPELCASTITLDGSAEPVELSAAETAAVINIFEGLAKSTDPVQSADFSPTHEITFNGSVYQVDKESGIFSVSADGETLLFQLYDNWLTHAYLNGGIGTYDMSN